MVEKKHEKKFLRTIFNDFNTLFKDIFSGKFVSKMKQDVAALHDYFLDKAHKQRLDKMSKLRRWIYLPFWLIKILILKLSSFRRVLAIVAIIFLLSARNNGDSSTIILGGLIFLFILLLELKDKLLVRDELEAGRSVQRALMPVEIPIVDGWDVWLKTQPANDVGGDLVDFIELGKNTYVIAVGDVAGKGLGAALLMAKLQSTLRALLPEIKSLSNLAGKINQVFIRDSLPSKFASMVAIRFNSESGKIELINAGHFPPMVIKNRKVSELRKGAPAFGILDKSEYTEENLELTKGEMLFIYSDGITEACDSHGEFFGEERLIRILTEMAEQTPAAIGTRLLAEVKQFTGDAPTSDDLSVAILKRK